MGDGQTRPTERHKQADSHVGQLLGHNEPVAADESVAGGLDALLAFGRERDVRDAGMPAIERPLRLAVAGDEDAGGRHNGDFVSTARGQRRACFAMGKGTLCALERERERGSRDKMDAPAPLKATLGQARLQP